MTKRQIVQLEGTVANANLPAFTVPETAIAVANILSLAAWPGMGVWAVNEDNDGLMDRMTDDEWLANGWATVGSRFFAADGSYSIQSASMAIKVPGFDTSGSFTVGMRVSPTNLASVGGSRFGSYTNAAGLWFMWNNAAGALRFHIAGKESQFADYSGPAVVADDYAYIVLSLDRNTGTIRLRVNGTYEQTLQHDDLKTASVLNELMFGAINATGTVQEGRGFYAKCVGFTDYLEGEDLSKLEAYLASSIRD